MAGAKAGILGGIFFAAVVTLFNVVLLEAFKSSALLALQTSPQTAADCSGAAAQNCFSTLLSATIPTFVAFPLGVTGILFGGLYGQYFEFLPGQGYRIRAALMGLLMLIMMLVFGLAGFTVDQTSKSIMDAFDTLAMIGYALIIAHFYRRYTREVRFESPNHAKLTITVDHKDFTEKTKTLSLHSTHTIRAPSESGSFHEWLVSGGVSVLDSKSFETVMKVDGDGLLKIT